MNNDELLQQIQCDINEIKHCLVGSLQNKGVVQRLDEVEKKQAWIHTKLLGLITAGSIVGSALLIVFRTYL